MCLSRFLSEERLERQPYLASFAVMAFAALLFLPGLGARDFWAPGEPIYAEVVRTMYERNDWLLPMLNGQIYADKPVLYFWLALIFSKIAGGVNEWTLRLPTAMGGLGLVWITYQFGKTFYDRPTGFLSGLVLATSSRVLWESRFLRLDTVLSFFLFLGFYFFLKAFTKKTSGRDYLIAYLCFALATLTKGPIGLVLPGSAFLALIVITGRWREIAEMRLVSGFFIVALVLVPWLWLLHVKGDDEWLKVFIWTHNIQNYALKPIGHVHPFYYYFANLPPDFLPWTLFVPGALLYYYPWKKRLKNPVTLALVCWFGAIFLFFSVSKSKIAYYLLPLLPSLAILVGCYLRALMAQESLQGAHWVSTAGFLYLLIVLLGLTGAALPVVTYRLERELFLRALLAAVIMVGGSISLFVYIRQKQMHDFLFSLLAVLLGVSLIASLAVLPHLNGYKSPRSIGEFIRYRVPADAPVYVFQSTMADFNFYAGREEIPVVRSVDDVVRLAHSDRHSYLIIDEKNLKRIDFGVKFKMIAEHLVGEKKWYVVSF